MAVVLQEQKGSACTVALRLVGDSILLGFWGHNNNQNTNTAYSGKQTIVGRRRTSMRKGALATGMANGIVYFQIRGESQTDSDHTCRRPNLE